MNSSRNSSSGSDRAVGSCGNFRRPCVALSVSRCSPRSWASRPRRETAQGFWRRRRARTDRGSPRRHLPGGLYGAVRDQDLCAARVSEEIEARHRDTEARARAHPRAAEMGRAIAHRESQGGLTMTTHFEKSSGNVFADLGLPNSEQELLKAKLTVQIYKLIKDQQLTQTKAAELLGTTQAQVSALMRCRPVSVSVGRLMEFLTVLGQDVEVTVKPASTPNTGHMSVVVQPG